MLIPAVNPQQAGLTAASADMNNYSAAASFLCSPLMVQATAVASAQTLTGSVITAITWAAPARDNDTTWAGGSPDRFTLQTQGYYDVAAHIGVNDTAAAAECWIQLTTGAANPAGAGNVTSWWHCAVTSAFAGTAMFPGSAGLIPVLIYPGDFLQLMVQASATTSTAPVSGLWGDWHHQMVST